MRGTEYAELAAFAAIELQRVIALRPDTKGKRRARHFVEGLAQELRTSPTHVNPDAATAGLLDRSNATIGRHRITTFLSVKESPKACRYSGFL